MPSRSRVVRYVVHGTVAAMVSTAMLAIGLTTASLAQGTSAADSHSSHVVASGDTNGDGYADYE